MNKIFYVNVTDRFTTVLYRYGSFYRVVMLTKVGDTVSDLPACYREYRSFKEAQNCYNSWNYDL